jgi:hypothetical protein
MSHLAPSIDPAEAAALTDALRSMGWLHAGETPHLSPLTGVSSTIVRADTARGPVCVKRALARLKVAAEWHAPVGRNAAEVAWIRFAAGVSPGAVPEVLGEDRGIGAFAMTWLPRRSFPSGRRSCGTVGSTLRSPPRSGADWSRSMRPAPLGRRWPACSITRPTSTPCGSSLISSMRRSHTPTGPRPCTASPQGVRDRRVALVHGDVSPKHILAGPDGPVFLDAECACWADPAFDLAFCLNHLLLKGCWRPTHLDAYLDCFEALASNDLAGVGWESAAACAERRSCGLLSGLLLARHRAENRRSSTSRTMPCATRCGPWPARCWRPLPVN